MRIFHFDSSSSSCTVDGPKGKRNSISKNTGNKESHFAEEPFVADDPVSLDAQ